MSIAKKILEGKIEEKFKPTDKKKATNMLSSAKRTIDDIINDLGMVGDNKGALDSAISDSQFLLGHFKKLITHLEKMEKELK